MPRRNSSFSIAIFTAADVASTAGVVSHVSRVIPSPASWTSSRSRSPRTCPVGRWPTLSDVSARTRSRGRDHLHQRHHTGPRHVRADQELRRLVEQQGRGVVLHRPVLQELLQLLQRLPAGRHRLPVQVLQNQLQMIAASSAPAARTVPARRGTPPADSPAAAPRPAAPTRGHRGTNPSHGSVHS